MIDLMNAAYQKCAVANTGSVCPAPEHGIDLEMFQSVEISATAMQQDGLITIQELHRESQTGRHLIDVIRFVRMR